MYSLYTCTRPTPRKAHPLSTKPAPQPAPTTPRSWNSDIWTTISFTPTTGWVNRFQAENGDTFTTPCPGVIVQELREVMHMQEVPSTTGAVYDIRSRSEHQQAPYATRTVAADIDHGDIIAADETGNYIGTNILGEDR